MNPSARYDRLLSLRRDESFDPKAYQATLALHYKTEPITKFQTDGKRTFFLLREVDESEDRCAMYRVFIDEQSAQNGDDEVGYCHLQNPIQGIVTVASAEVKEGFRNKGIATAVYDCIVSDLERVGALLWPAAPSKMTDAEFKIWWRRSPALVFYYPHRERLGFEPRYEFETLLNEGSANAGHAFRASSGSAAIRAKVKTMWQRLKSKRHRTGD